MSNLIRLEGDQPLLDRAPLIRGTNRTCCPKGEGHITEVVGLGHSADKPTARFLDLDSRKDRRLHSLVFTGKPDEGDCCVAKARAFENELTLIRPNSKRKQPLLRPVHAREATNGHVPQLGYPSR